MARGKGSVLGGTWGLRLREGARHGSLGVIASVAAPAAPQLVTAAVPHDLRIDPCEKKSKRNELRRVEQGTLVAACLVSMVVPFHLLLRKRSGEVRKK